MVTSPSNTFTLSLEGIAVMLGIIVSLTILINVLVQYSNKITKIEHNLLYIKQELVEHTKSEGHTMLSDKNIVSSDGLHKVEKALELHISDYVNRKETVQFLLGQLDEKIQHKFNRTATALNNIQRYLEKDGGFKMRDSLSDREE